MTEQSPAPAAPGGEPGPDAGEASEITLLRELLRTQEEHREGGVEPELSPDSSDPAGGA
ncbi:MAG TPA: hypothetical protein VMH35_28690 [Streptosporangiaceae bacterium]|nr:hypothetical protein [Streptosporangiaceae bacterium]